MAKNNREKHVKKTKAKSPPGSTSKGPFINKLINKIISLKLNLK